MRARARVCASVQNNQKKISITEYMGLSKAPDDPRYQTAFQRRNDGVGWHGFKLLHNPLCAEFGIRTAQELDEFIQDDLPDFAMVSERVSEKREDPMSGTQPPVLFALYR